MNLVAFNLIVYSDIYLLCNTYGRSDVHTTNIQAIRDDKNNIYIYTVVSLHINNKYTIDTRWHSQLKCLNAIDYELVCKLYVKSYTNHTYKIINLIYDRL